MVAIPAGSPPLARLAAGNASFWQPGTAGAF